MRQYFKEDVTEDARKLYDFAKNNGASYFEDTYAIWKCPKKYDVSLMAIQLNISGELGVGIINESCDNFQVCNHGMYAQEVDWLMKMCAVLKEYGLHKYKE